MAAQPESLNDQRRQHFEAYGSNELGWRGAYLHGPEGVENGMRMLDWAGQNFPYWEPQKPALTMSTYNGFRDHVMETFDAQLPEGMNQTERAACRKAFARKLKPVHKPIVKDLTMKEAQERAHRAATRPAEAMQQQQQQQQTSAELVPYLTAAQPDAGTVCEQLQLLGRDVQQQFQLVRMQIAEQSVKVSRLENEVNRRGPHAIAPPPDAALYLPPPPSRRKRIKLR